MGVEASYVKTAVRTARLHRWLLSCRNAQWPGHCCTLSP